MNRFEWMEARAVSDAVTAATATVADAMVSRTGERLSDQAVVVKAGGIDLLDLIKEGLLTPRRLVNLRGVAELGAIAASQDGTLRIGAMATLAEVAAHPVVRERYRALADAAGRSASPQIRQVATLGGNLLQRPRCWYFRSAEHHCARKGGEGCFAFAGENQHHAIFDHRGCAMVHPSTAATALVALDAEIEIANPQGGKREVRLEDFFLLPAVDLHRENDLAPGEIVTAIVLPALGPTARSVHIKQGERDSSDWPLADVAVVLDLAADGTCRLASVVLGAAAPVPHRAKAAEAALLGHVVDESTARAAASAALTGASALTKNEYKLPIFETLVRRAILAAAGAAHKD
jgi:xanthine dehydrogenase YagS FAD-binding subunit